MQPVPQITTAPHKIPFVPAANAMTKEKERQHPQRAKSNNGSWNIMGNTPASFRTWMLASGIRSETQSFVSWTSSGRSTPLMPKQIPCVYHHEGVNSIAHIPSTSVGWASAVRNSDCMTLRRFSFAFCFPTCLTTVRVQNMSCKWDAYTILICSPTCNLTYNLIVKSIWSLLNANCSSFGAPTVNSNKQFSADAHFVLPKLAKFKLRQRR